MSVWHALPPRRRRSALAPDAGVLPSLRNLSMLTQVQTVGMESDSSTSRKAVRRETFQSMGAMQKLGLEDPVDEKIRMDTFEHSTLFWAVPPDMGEPIANRTGSGVYHTSSPSSETVGKFVETIKALSSKVKKCMVRVGSQYDAVERYKSMPDKTGSPPVGYDVKDRQQGRLLDFPERMRLLEDEGFYTVGSGYSNFVFEMRFTGEYASEGNEEWVKEWQTLTQVRYSYGHQRLALRMGNPYRDFVNGYDPKDSKKADRMDFLEMLLQLNAAARGYGPPVHMATVLTGMGTVVLTDRYDADLFDALLKFAPLAQQQAFEGAIAAITKASDDGLLMTDLKPDNILVKSWKVLATGETGADVFVSDFDPNYTVRVEASPSNVLCVHMLNMLLFASSFTAVCTRRNVIEPALASLVKAALDAAVERFDRDVDQFHLCSHVRRLAARYVLERKLNTFDDLHPDLLSTKIDAERDGVNHYYQNAAHAAIRMILYYASDKTALQGQFPKQASDMLPGFKDINFDKKAIEQIVPICQKLLADMASGASS